MSQLKPETKEKSKRLSTAASRLATATFVTLLLSGCVTRKKINAYLWLHGGLPEETCERYPELRDSGIFRTLQGGKVEFVSYCDDKILKFLDMHKDDLARLLNEKPESKQQAPAQKP